MSRKGLFAVFIMLIVPVTASSQWGLAPIPVRHFIDFESKNYFLCTKVIDGDKIVVKMGQETVIVQLIGVDTPETDHPRKPNGFYGQEALNFTKKMAEGKEVKLEYDSRKFNKLEHLLAYVYFDDDWMLNADIIIEGYGRADKKFPFKYLDKFKKYEIEARENKMGMWGADPSLTIGI